MHWGAEYQDQPNLYQKNFNQFFKRQGVDIVIGSHPHVVQPMHYIKNNDKEFLTVYSLGNFVSNQRDFRKDGGVMFRCSIVKRDKASISDKEYILNEDYVKMQVYSEHAKNLFADYNINILEGLPYPKIHLQKHQPQELSNQKNIKWIKKLNLFKYRKNKNAK